MKNTDLIIATEFCAHQHVEITFLRSLQQSGLIELMEEADVLYIPFSEITNVEKFSRLHYEMDINIEGLETISHLLGKMDAMQQKIKELSNRLSLYE